MVVFQLSLEVLKWGRGWAFRNYWKLFNKRTINESSSFLPSGGNWKSAFRSRKTAFNVIFIMNLIRKGDSCINHRSNEAPLWWSPFFSLILTKRWIFDKWTAPKNARNRAIKRVFAKKFAKWSRPNV